jgi:PilZ domain
MGMMTSQYRSVAPASVERRMAVRRTVYLTLLEMDSPEPETHVATLDDLSKYGCRLATDACFKTGECLFVQFDDSNPVAACVVWNENGKLGCRFDEALDPGVFRQMTITAN